ncbi:ribonucleotide reductase N-terminal alpha domain-containing protein, partial [Petrimonas sp.]
MKKEIYTFDEAYNASLEYFRGDELAAKVWVSKYALKDSEGNIYEKTPEDMHWRLANEVG